jgi:CRP-like cAMP-binding protein
MAYTEHDNVATGVVIPLRTSDRDVEWREFARSTRVKYQRLEQHSVVFYEGDKADRVFEVIEGAVMLFKLLPDGRRQVVDVLGPEDVFGLPRGRDYDCNAETLSRTTLRVLDRRDAETRTEVQGHLTRCLTAQVEKLHDHAVLLGRKSAFERVASFLFRCVPACQQLDCLGDQRTGGESVIVLNMTRQEIADYLGLTIETVSRVISEFKRKGLILLEKQDRIRINNLCGICRLTGAH